MRIKDFSLRGFRNIGHVEIRDMANINEWVGLNGQGKTNLLEAVYFGLTGSSFRGADVAEMVGEGGDGFEIDGLLENDSGLASKLKVSVTTSGPVTAKTFLLDDQKVGKQDLAQRYPVVVFSPEEVDLVRSTPQARRRLIDQVGALTSQTYTSLVFEYVRIWRNRNQLLLAIKQRRADESELDLWDEQIARVGVEIIKTRRAAVERLGDMTQGPYKMFASNGRLELRYAPNLNVFSEAEYQQELRQARQLDIVKTHTTRGIHRDDLLILESGARAVERSSRGEFRSIVLSMKLGYGQLAHGVLGERPVYLLDDVMAELDDERRAALLASLEGFQVVVTGHEELGLEKSWRVTAGRVAEVVAS